LQLETQHTNIAQWNAHSSQQQQQQQQQRHQQQKGQDEDDPDDKWKAGGQAGDIRVWSEQTDSLSAQIQQLKFRLVRRGLDINDVENFANGNKVHQPCAMKRKQFTAAAAAAAAAATAAEGTAAAAEAIRSSEAAAAAAEA
jgi:hypothetical protein